MSGIGVRIGANNTEFSKAMQQMKNDLKLAQSSFSVTATQAKLFGSSLDQLKVKQEQLTDKIKRQNEMISAYKGRIDGLKTNISKLSDVQNKLREDIDKANKKYEESVKSTGKNSEESKKLKEDLNKLNKQYKTNEGTLERQRKQMQNATMSMNRLEQATLKDKRALEETNKQIKESTSKWNKFKDVAKATSNGIDKAKDKFDSFKTSVLAITGVITGVTGVSASFANDYEKAMARFDAKSYSSQRNVEEFGKIMKEVYSDNYGENFEEIGEAMRYVNQYLHISGDELKQCTENAFGFRDAFGYETSESIRAVKALMDNFGTTAEEAFNLMIQGEQDGLDYSGELIDNINEYSVQFGKLGLSAEDMFNIFSTGMANGAFNLDKIGDAVKEFSIRAIDGSNTTIDGFTKLGLNADEMAKKFSKGGDSAKNAFFQVIQAIGDMQNPVEQSIVGVDLFGRI